MSGIAVVIFVLVYLVIILGEHSPRMLDRPAAALIGAVLMVICGVETRGQALASIDFATLALLFGMMIVVHYATVSGLLDALAHRLMHFGKTPVQLLWVVCYGSGLLSALFVNDTICLLMTPLLLSLTKRAKLPPEPYLICLATGSNVGSAITITGNPQNMLIGQSSHWSWSQFALLMLPIGLVCLAINAAIVQFVYRKSLSPETVGARLASPVGTDMADGTTYGAAALNRKLATKTIVVTVGLLIGFLAGAAMDMVALTAGIIMLVWANRPPEETFEKVDWSLLLFFAGLFVVVDGVNRTNAQMVASIVPAFTQHATGLIGLLNFAAATVVGSNIFGNVPFVMLMRGWIDASPNAHLLWLVLAMSSTFAGNLTLVGSVANLIVANGARREAPLTFISFLKAGVPSTIVGTTLGTVVLYSYHAAGFVK